MNITIPTIQTIQINPSHLAIGVVVVVGFILFILLAYMSRGFLSWSFSGAGFGFVFGLIVAAILVGLVFYFGRGGVKAVVAFLDNKTTLQGALAKKEDQTAILGTETQKISSQTINSDFDSLASEEKDLVKNYICKP